MILTNGETALIDDRKAGKTVSRTLGIPVPPEFAEKYFFRRLYTLQKRQRRKQTFQVKSKSFQLTSGW